jgi:hypothetical protein
MIAVAAPWFFFLRMRMTASICSSAVPESLFLTILMPSAARSLTLTPKRRSMRTGFMPASIMSGRCASTCVTELMLSPATIAA